MEVALCVVRPNPSIAPSSYSYAGLLGIPGVDRVRRNESVRALERLLLEQPQVDVQTQNLIHGGMCVRWIFVPAGTALTGATTTKDNVCVVIGDINVTTDEGVERVVGFRVLPASAGHKRGGYAHADTWWATVWRTELTDIEAIEDEMTPESAMLQTRRTCIGQRQLEIEG